MTGKRQWARDVTLVHRLRFPSLVNYLCYSAWGACYAVADLGHLLTTPVLGAIAANMLLILAALVLNTTVDVHTDERDPGKHGIAATARRWGHRRCLWWAATETMLGLILAVMVASSTHHWLVAVAAGLIIVSHTLYNLEPMRLKRRGLAGPAVIGLSFGFLPCLVSYSSIQPTVDNPLWPIFIGLGLLAAGRMIWRSIPDRDADRATGISTPAVRYGINRTLTTAYAVGVAGLGTLGWGLSWQYGSTWALAGVVVCGVVLVCQRTTLRQSRAMTVIATGNVLLGTIPLLAT